MSNLITISNVRGFIDKEGTAQLNLEDVSKGLGFTQVKNEKDYVRWERVNEYLKEYGFPTSGENDFIPENIFYLLAMKASNQTAVAFQMKVANEILPSIRKTGSYSTKKEPKKSNVPNEAQMLRAQAMHKNAVAAQAKLMKEIASEFQSKLSGEAVQLLLGGITELLMGRPLLPMPTIDKTYTATEIGAELGVTSIKIGKLANANNLKTDEYGITVLDKSPYSAKQIPSFRYNEKGRERLIELVGESE